MEAPAVEPRRRRLGPLVLILVGLSLVGLVVVTVVVALGEMRRRHRSRSKCPGNLRQVALAAIQYCDDRRFFPHLSKLHVLDNAGKTTPTGSDVSPRCFRALVHFNYLDDPGSFVCPDSDDQAVPITDPALRADLRFWGWGGRIEDGTNPIVKAGVGDVDAEALTDLSYGWTIKGYTANCRSLSPLAADVTRRTDSSGTHRVGWNVVFADGHSQFVAEGSAEAAKLAGTAPGEGFLSIRDDTTSRPR